MVATPRIMPTQVTADRIYNPSITNPPGFCLSNSPVGSLIISFACLLSNPHYTMPKRASRDDKEEVVVDDDDDEGAVGDVGDLVELSSSGEGGEEGKAAVEVSAAHETLEISSSDEDEQDGHRGRSSGGGSGSSKLEVALVELDKLRVGSEKPPSRKKGGRKSVAGQLRHPLDNAWVA